MSNTKNFKNSKLLQINYLNWLIIYNYDTKQVNFIPFVFNKNKDKLKVLTNQKIYEINYNNLTENNFTNICEFLKIKYQIQVKVLEKIAKEHFHDDKIQFEVIPHSNLIKNKLTKTQSNKIVKNYHIYCDLDYIDINNLNNLIKYLNTVETFYFNHLKFSNFINKHFINNKQNNIASKKQIEKKKKFLDNIDVDHSNQLLEIASCEKYFREELTKF